MQYYLHHNARKHRLVKHFDDYRYTSYRDILAGNATLIDLEEIIFRFGSIEDFKIFHNESHWTEKFSGILIEE